MKTKKDFTKIALIITASVFVIGIILVLCSGQLGQNAGDSMLQNYGGLIDTSIYERTIKTTITNTQIIGGILSIFGAFGVLLSGFATYRELPE